MPKNTRACPALTGFLPDGEKKVDGKRLQMHKNALLFL
jgi:hypothetical protein